MSLSEINQKVLDTIPAQYAPIFSEFFKICEVPHGSGNRAGIVKYFVNWAATNKFECTTDASDNVLIRIPAYKGCESAPGICLQAHSDMVCVKDPQQPFNFETDKLQMRIEDGWLKATGTTLGADNGVGIALAFAAAKDQTVKHGPIEILLTSDEEIGLIGAAQLKQCLAAKYLLNLDSEEFGDICVSCAGGFRVQFEKKLQQQQLDSQNRISVKVKISGYLGGHSGCEIHLHRANAIKQLGKLLKQFGPENDLRIGSILGGSAHNAIPATAEATISFKPFICKRSKQPCGCGPAVKLQKIYKQIHEAFATKEPSGQIEVSDFQMEKAFSYEDSLNLVNFLVVVPHGPVRVSQDVENLVETSFAATVLESSESGVKLLCSGRSCHEQELDFLYQQVKVIGEFANWSVSEALSRYPGWPAKMDSPLIKIVEDAYKKHSDKVKINAIHAGLEAGMICKQHPGMEAISIGPTIVSPHSPQERCKVDTVGKIYEIIKGLLEKIAE